MRILTLASLLLLAACPNTDDGLNPRTCEVVLRYVPPAGEAPDSVFVAGEWNGFSDVAQPLQKQGEAFVISLEALVGSPRDWAYEFVVDGRRQRDPGNGLTRWVANQELSRLTVPDCSQPVLKLERFELTPSRGLAVEATYFDGLSTTRSAAPEIILTLNGEPQQDVYVPGEHHIHLHKGPLAPGRHTVRITAKDAEGREAAPLLLPFWVEDEPFRWESGALYFTFTDRFRNGDPGNDGPAANVDVRANWQGGDFAGITQAIESGYFDALGVRSLWLSPVNNNPAEGFPGSFGKSYTGYHGYWPVAARSTDPHFGTLEELKALTSAAHARGIRVMGDLVLNHVHEQHDYWREYRDQDWFHLANSCVCGSHACGWDERAIDCKFAPYLPDLNWKSPAATDRAIEDVLWWVSEAGFDGFRLDALKHMEDTALTTLRHRLRELTAATGMEFYLLGETFVWKDGHEQLKRSMGPDKLDGQFDFPLYFHLVDVFARGASMEDLELAAQANEAVGYPEGTVNSPFLGNHDVPRFLSIAAGQVWDDAGAQAWSNERPAEHVDADAPFAAARLAFTFVMTQPGVPLVYYGDEIGLTGAGDPDNRRFMRWDEETLTEREKALRTHVQTLGKARRASLALQLGARSSLSTEVDHHAYQREHAESGAGAFVVLNRGSGELVLPLTLKGGLATGTRSWKDVLGGSTVTSTDGAVTVTVPAGSSAVYVTQ